MFTLLLVFASVIIVILLLLPLFSAKQQVTILRHQLNLEAATVRLHELKAELDAGSINEAQFKRYRLELEMMTLEELKTESQKPETNTVDKAQRHNIILAIVIALAVPAFAVSVYQQIGSEEAISGLPTNQEDKALKKVLAALEDGGLNNLNDLKGKLRLAQAYMETGRYREAAVIYEEMYQLYPQVPELLVIYADALARAHDNRLAGKPAELLNEALKIAPEHKGALWLAGLAAIQAHNKAQALTHWRRLVADLELGSEMHRQITALISEIESEHLGPPTTLKQR